MNKLVKKFDELDIQNVGQGKRLLGGLQADILFFSRRNNKNELLQLSSFLRDWMSINQKETNQGGGVPTHVQKQFYNGIELLINQCQEALAR